MRYLKVFILVVVFFLVMLFFVQNQASFDEPVVLTLDLMFVPVMESFPLPLYSIMLICFTLGGFLVLLMLMWDRVSLTARCTTARSKVSGLEKKLQKSEVALKHAVDNAVKKEEALNAQVAELKAQLDLQSKQVSLD